MQKNQNKSRQIRAATPTKVFWNFFEKPKIQGFWTWFTRFRAPTLGGHQTTTRLQIFYCPTCPVLLVLYQIWLDHQSCGWLP